MANRRFEMYEIRQIIARLRLGESDRDIARSQTAGRKTVAAVRKRASTQGWFEAASSRSPSRWPITKVPARPASMIGATIR